MPIEYVGCLLGCLLTRKSTSCSVVFHGKHMMKTACATQQQIALSCAETTCVGVGFVNLLRSWDMEVELVLRGDAAGAAGIANRHGAEVRHIECATLWLQRYIGQSTTSASKRRI
eukprot:4569601-Amphidinium_carterae.1